MKPGGSHKYRSDRFLWAADMWKCLQVLYTVAERTDCNEKTPCVGLGWPDTAGLVTGNSGGSKAEFADNPRHKQTRMISLWKPVFGDRWWLAHSLEPIGSLVGTALSWGWPLTVAIVHLVVTALSWGWPLTVAIDPLVVTALSCGWPLTVAIVHLVVTALSCGWPLTVAIVHLVVTALSCGWPLTVTIDPLVGTVLSCGWPLTVAIVHLVGTVLSCGWPLTVAIVHLVGTVLSCGWPLTYFWLLSPPPCMSS